LAALVVVSTQFAPHSVWPVAQPQFPLEQPWPAGQAWPQLPQLRLLVITFTQALLQFIRPAAQVVPQRDWLQTWPPVQMLVQVPQCMGSELVSTQLDPHRASEPEQVHALSVQVWPVVHFVPQPPQLSLSDVVSTHIWPHSMRPTAH
jgi:hypothetical protein